MTAPPPDPNRAAGRAPDDSSDRWTFDDWMNHILFFAAILGFAIVSFA